MKVDRGHAHNPQPLALSNSPVDHIDCHWSSGTVPVELIKGLKAPEMACALGLLQKACLLGSARILRKILDTQGGLI